MITSESISWVLNNLLSKEEIFKEIDEKGDFIKLEIHTFNLGSVATIKSVDYDETEEEEITSNGNIYCDKDSFITMLAEQKIFRD